MVTHDHQRRDQSRLKKSIFNSLPGRCRHRLGQRPGSQTVTSCCPEKRTCLATVHAARVPSGILRQKEEPTSDCSKEQNTALPWSCGRVHPCPVARPQKPPHQMWRFDSGLLALLPLRRRLVTRKGILRLGEIAFHAVHLDTWVTPPSLRRVAHGGSCAPLHPPSGSRRDPRACHPSTSSEYP